MDDKVTVVRQIPLAEPVLAGNEARYLQECVETNFVSTVGPFVARFEEKIAELAGASHCVSVSSGTSGLHLALTAVGVQRDDLVVVPSYTFIASANAISHCGAMPWLFDVTEDSWTLSPELLRERLAEDTERRAHGLVHKQTGRRVGAILPVYTLGIPADMDAIAAIAEEFGLPVIADAAAAQGATYKGRALAHLGTELSVFSFNGNKTITTGGGGAIFGNDKTLIDRVRHLSSTARVGRNYDHDAVGYNYRLSNVSAAVGLAQVERFHELAEAKRRISRTYDQAFADLSAIAPLPQPEWAEHACWLSGIVVDAQRADLERELKRVGVDVRSFWKPMHRQLPYRDAPATTMKTVDAFWERVVILPSSSNLTAADQQNVIDAVRRVFA